MQQGYFTARKKAFLGVALLVFLVLPMVSFGGSDTVYVDGSASGTQNGSAKNPYKTIGKALDKAGKGDVVRVKAGTYKENVTIPQGVKLMSDSENRDSVVIKSKNDEKPTVTMKNGSKLASVTIKEGRHGVRVAADAKANIYNVTIKNAVRDGIHADAAAVNDTKLLTIDKVYSAKNGMAGIYSESRKITILNSDIDSNKLDGIDLQGRNKAWIEDVRSRWNHSSGLKAVVDGSTITAKSSDFRNNGQAGVEAISNGGNGSLTVKKGSIVGNASYGVAKVQRAGTFKGLFLGDGVNKAKFRDNGKSEVSPLLRSF